jgi:hypothetical protein
MIYCQQQWQDGNIGMIPWPRNIVSTVANRKIAVTFSNARFWPPSNLAQCVALQTPKISWFRFVGPLPPWHPKKRPGLLVQRNPSRPLVISQMISHSYWNSQPSVGAIYSMGITLSTQWHLKQDYYMHQQKIQSICHTGTCWSLWSLTILWAGFFIIWKSRNEAINGHDLTSQQQAWKCQLQLEMACFHAQRDQVLAIDADIFMGEMQADLHHFLDTSTATQIQNWLYVWKPFIMSSVRSAKNFSLQGVHTMSTYFTPLYMAPPRPISNQSHQTARPSWLRVPRALPQPSFHFQSLHSFFALLPTPGPIPWNIPQRHFTPPLFLAALPSPGGFTTSGKTCRDWFSSRSHQFTARSLGSALCTLSHQ